MDRCVVLVDAGYLLGAAASLLAGEPARSRITVDHAALIQGLRQRAEADTERPLLRIYWFDGAPDRVPQPEHRRLRVMPRVTVRLGALTRSDGRWAQKGVDAAMHAELTELARNRACSDIVLVTGDGDLLPGLMSAKEHGVAVHLWAVQAADGDYNQSEDLVAEADERRVLDRTWITRAVRAKEIGGPCAPPPAPRPEIAAILSAPLPESAAAAAAAAGTEPAEHTHEHNGANGVSRPAAGAGSGPAATGEPGAAGSKVVPTPKDLAGLGRAHAAGQQPPARAARSPRRAPPCAGPPTRAGSSAAARPASRTPPPHCPPSPSSPAPSSAGPTARRTSPPSAATPSRSARSSPAAGPTGSPTPRTSSSCPRSTRASRTGSTVNCCATPPGSDCSPTRTTRSTSTTAMRSGPVSGARSICGRPPSTPRPGTDGPHGPGR